MGEEQKQPKNDEAQTETLEQALETEKRHSEEYLSRLKYMQADFENLKKRLDRQIEDVRYYCNERLVVDLLEVVDELELAVDSAQCSDSSDTLVQGVKMTLKKLRKVLETQGVAPIDCMGKPFDPSKHSAVAHVEKEDTKEGMIVEEIRKGYIMKGKVIRPSIVKVTVKPSSKPEKGVCKK
jgi:molecular chaperone GrpE